MHRKTLLLALVSLVGRSLATTMAGAEISESTTTLEAKHSLGQAARDEIDAKAVDVEERGSEARTRYPRYPAVCDADTTEDGVDYATVASYCAYGDNLRIYVCYMMPVGQPFDWSRVAIERRECFDGYACVPGGRDFGYGRDMTQAWCMSKHETARISLPNNGGNVFTARYGVTAEAGQDGHTATVLVMDPTLNNGINISEIDIQPMVQTQIGLYPYGQKVTCTNADACSLFGLPVGTVHLETTLTASKGLEAAMMLAVTS